MPRKAPDGNGVVEHRLTLGNYERTQLAETIDAYQKDKLLENVPNILMGTAAVALVGVVGYGGYLLYKAFDIWPDLDPNQEAILSRAFNMSQAYHPDHPEWARFGAPQNTEELYVMLEQNQNMLEDKLLKCQATLDAANSIGGYGGVFAMAAVSKAKTWIDVAYPKLVESLELWRIYWEEKIALQTSNPLD
jgi:hypothetical protein